MERHSLVKGIVENIENGIFVEIGTHNGDFADHILRCSKNSKLYCIDPYISYSDYDDAINNTVGDSTYNATYSRLTSKYGDRVQMIRKFSEDAVKDVPDTIDFLYIDGNHQYKYVRKDLELYYPKVKMNRYIVGDDAIDINDSDRNENGDILRNWAPGSYGHYGVVKAFREFSDKHMLVGEIQAHQYILYKS